MSFDVNRFQIIGRVVEAKKYPRSTTIKIASKRSWRTAIGELEQHTTFMTVVVWRESTQHYIANYLKPGDTIGAEGHIESQKSLPTGDTPSYETVELVATRVGKIVSAYTDSRKKIDA